MTQEHEIRMPTWKEMLKEFAFPVVMFVLWTAGLGLASYWIWTGGMALSERHVFLLVASVFGAVGGLARAIRDVQIFSWRRWRNMATGSPTNNLILKPVLWPIPGAILGLVLAFIFLDEKTSPLKVALLGSVGGICWVKLLSNLPGMFSVEKPDKE